MTPSEERALQLRTAMLITAGLIVLGVVVGLAWTWWSPAGPPGVQLKAGTVQIDESETFAAADGRFAVLTGIVGLAAGLSVWFLRAVRGPIVALALGIGGLAGAWVTGLVGHLAGGGTNSGPPQTEIPHLPLNVHLTGLYMLEGLLAVLLYAIQAAFAADDDLGRPDPERDALRTPVLVQAENVLQYGGAYGDGPGLAQQDQFPPQDPGQYP